MKFCQNHWDKLKAAIKARGLGDLIAATGEEAMKQMVGELEGEKQTIHNFEPLMVAHNMILINAMELAGKIGGDPMAIMMGHPEHPEWECPLCYLNWLSLEHDRICTLENCPKPKGMTFDDWIDLAADGAAQQAKSFKLE